MSPFTQASPFSNLGTPGSGIAYSPQTALHDNYGANGSGEVFSMSPYAALPRSRRPPPRRAAFASSLTDPFAQESVWYYEVQFKRYRSVFSGTSDYRVGDYVKVRD